MRDLLPLEAATTDPYVTAGQSCCRSYAIHAKTGSSRSSGSQEWCRVCRRDAGKAAPRCGTVEVIDYAARTVRVRGQQRDVVALSHLGHRFRSGESRGYRHDSLLRSGDPSAQATCGTGPRFRSSESRRRLLLLGLRRRRPARRTTHRSPFWWIAYCVGWPS